MRTIIVTLTEQEADSLLTPSPKKTRLDWVMTNNALKAIRIELTKLKGEVE